MGSAGDGRSAPSPRCQPTNHNTKKKKGVQPNLRQRERTANSSPSRAIRLSSICLPSLFVDNAISKRGISNLRRPVPSHEKPQIVRSSKVRVPIHSDNQHPTTDSADRGLSIFADRDLSGLLEVSLRSCSPSAVALPDCIHRRLPLDNDGTGPVHVFGGAHTFPIFPFCKSGTGPPTRTLSAGCSPGDVNAT